MTGVQTCALPIYNNLMAQAHQRGVLINGKLSVTVASNNLTVAIKTYAGTDPTTSDPVTVRIGDTLRDITSALSVTKNAGTNWCNLGSAELATNEEDLFAFMGYNATDGTTLGFSRFPGANQYDDFSATTTNEKYCAISDISNAAAGDDYELIGRFAATLSAGAGYTWTVPTFTTKNLIQRPIYETRWLDWTPIITVSGGTAPTYTATFSSRYKVSYDDCFLEIIWSNTSGGTAGAGTSTMFITTPFSANNFIANRTPIGVGQVFDNGQIEVSAWARFSTATQFLFTYTSTVPTAQFNITGNDQSEASRFICVNGSYQI